MAHLASGQVSHARSVLITTAVSYRRLDAPGLQALLGAGALYRRHRARDRRQPV